jgi:ABC-type lipoprotein release transport system permease subunit
MIKYSPKLNVYQRARVVGVVDDIQYDLPGTPAKPAIYVLATNQPPTPAVLLVRTQGANPRLSPDLERAAREVDNNFALEEVQAMTSWLVQATSSTRFLARVMAFYGMIAFLVAAIGVYSVVAYAVEQRLLELAIRRALGASALPLVRQVLREATGVAAFGLSLGLLAAIGAGRVLTNQLYGVSGHDVWPYALCIGAFGGAVLVASIAPALRAVRIDPANAIRGSSSLDS